MRPPEAKHLIKAKRRVKRKVESTLLDIRTTSWSKIKNKWKSTEGWYPSDSESEEKVKRWVQEITRITPIWDEYQEELSEEEILEKQLSAVEGHKKIEIITTWKDRQKPNVEEPQEPKEIVPIGIELEKKPWAEKAKLISALTAGLILASILIYHNNQRRPQEQTILSPTVGTATEKLGFSRPIEIKGVGTAYLYNQNWQSQDDQKILEEIKPLAISLISSYNNLKIDNILFSTKEKRKRIADIDDEKIPMLVVVPEGKDLEENNTKIWVSKLKLIFIERTLNQKTTWSIGRIKNEEILDTSILKR